MSTFFSKNYFSSVSLQTPLHIVYLQCLASFSQNHIKNRECIQPKQLTPLMCYVSQLCHMTWVTRLFWGCWYLRWRPLWRCRGTISWQQLDDGTVCELQLSAWLTMQQSESNQGVDVVNETIDELVTEVT